MTREEFEIAVLNHLTTNGVMTSTQLRDAINEQFHIDMSIGRFYAYMEKLEDTGLIYAEEGKAPTETEHRARGHRWTFYYSITQYGRRTRSLVIGETIPIPIMAPR